MCVWCMVENKLNLGGGGFRLMLFRDTIILNPNKFFNPGNLIISSLS